MKPTNRSFLCAVFYLKCCFNVLNIVLCKWEYFFRAIQSACFRSSSVIADLEFFIYSRSRFCLNITGSCDKAPAIQIASIL